MWYWRWNIPRFIAWVCFHPNSCKIPAANSFKEQNTKTGVSDGLAENPSEGESQGQSSPQNGLVSFHDRGTLLGARTTIPCKNFLAGCYVRVPESSSFASQWRYLNVVLLWGVSRLFLSFYVVTTSVLSSVLVVCYVFGWPPKSFSTIVLYLKVKIDDTDTKVRLVKGPYINQYVVTVPSIFQIAINDLFQESITHRIHVWYIYPHLVDLYGKFRCR